MDMQTYLNPNDIHDNNNQVGVASLLYLSRSTDAGIFASPDLFFLFLSWVESKAKVESVENLIGCHALNKLKHPHAEYALNFSSLLNF